MPQDDEFVFHLGPLTILRSGRVWNVELFELVHLYGVGWSIWGGGFTDKASAGLEPEVYFGTALLYAVLCWLLVGGAVLLAW